MAARTGLDLATIVRKAAELADQEGFSALTMATLAAHLGVRTPALYHYFAGLPGLQRQLSLLGLQKAQEVLGRSVMGRAGDDALLALAHALRTFANEHSGLYEAASRAPDPGDQQWQEAGQEVIEILLRSLSAYHLSRDDTRHVVRMLRSIIHGYVSLERLGGFGPLPEVDATFRGLLVALLDYLHTHMTSEE